jgi:MarR family 2-MHQ and catechol resistance regulon transcriptional repressor
VSRVESADDRRVRIVALTAKGRKLIEPVFREHVAMLDQAFADLSPADRRRLEESLKKVGRRAALLFDDANSGKHPSGSGRRSTAASD